MISKVCPASKENIKYYSIPEAMRRRLGRRHEMWNDADGVEHGMPGASEHRSRTSLSLCWHPQSYVWERTNAWWWKGRERGRAGRRRKCCPEFHITRILPSRKHILPMSMRRRLTALQPVGEALEPNDAIRAAPGTIGNGDVGHSPDAGPQEYGTYHWQNGN